MKLTAQQLEAVKGQVQTVQKEKEQIQKVANDLAQGVVSFAEKQGELIASFAKAKCSYYSKPSSAMAKPAG